MSTSMRSWSTTVASTLLAGAIGWYLPAMVATQAERPTQSLHELDDFQLPEMSPLDPSLALLDQLDVVEAIGSKGTKAATFLAADNGKADPLTPFLLASDNQGTVNEFSQFQLACIEDLHQLRIVAILGYQDDTSVDPLIRYYWHGEKVTSGEGQAPIYETTKKFESGMQVRADYYVKKIGVDRVTFLIDFLQVAEDGATGRLDTLERTHRLRYTY